VFSNSRQFTNTVFALARQAALETLRDYARAVEAKEGVFFFSKAECGYRLRVQVLPLPR
jgi:hypothetical protein